MWPLAGIDYQQTFQAFDAYFAKEDRNCDYLRRVRLPSESYFSQCVSESRPLVAALRIFVL